MTLRPALLLLIIAVAFAGERSDFTDARDKLSEAYFDQLGPDDRDRLFEALCSYDANEVVSPIAEVASRFGTYMDALEAELDQLKVKVSAYTDRAALMDLEIGMRNSYMRQIVAKEEEWRRAQASQELLARLVGSFRDDRTIQSVLTYFTKHDTWRVRELLALACARWHEVLHDPATSRRVFDALKRLQRDAEPRVRMAMARSLGAFRRTEALDLLEDLLTKDDDWRVRAAAVDSLKAGASSETVGVLIRALPKQSGRIVDDTITALREITGQNHQFPESWTGWWKGVGEQLPPKAEASEGSPEGAEAEEDPQKTYKPGHRFYGIPTRSDRICYIIDVSGSMNKEVDPLGGPVTGKREGEMRAAGKTRIEVAKNELKRAIGNLGSKQQFTIIFFNQATMVWRREMVTATPANKQQAFSDIDAMVAKGATYTLGALREAFTIAGATPAKGRTRREGGGIDTIFLLSDGGPTDNRMDDPKPMDPDEILVAVREWNRNARIVIHTIAVHTQDLGTYFLKSLAGQNNGRFVERK